VPPLRPRRPPSICFLSRFSSASACAHDATTSAAKPPAPYAPIRSVFDSQKDWLGE
jgi:hypothetical protein